MKEIRSRSGVAAATPLAAATPEPTNASIDYVDIRVQALDDADRDMLKKLRLKNVGPSPDMELDLADRLNLITGDNGLGKSFLLEVAWWALTRTWAGHVVRPLVDGPKQKGDASIFFRFDGTAKTREFDSKYVPRDLTWSGGPGRPANPGLVVYARVDGGFAVWDPHRNQKSGKEAEEGRRIPPSQFLFEAEDVWEGLRDEGDRVCNGLIADWVTWQLGNGRPFAALTRALSTMSEPGWELRPGATLARIPGDSRQHPTIETSHGELVPLVLASAAVRRIAALAYLLVWAWEEHVVEAEGRALDPIDRVIFLIDEPECHLHPRWQRSVVPALLEVVRVLTEDASVQLVAATHSPLVLASAEPTFDPSIDAWFDLDLVQEGDMRRVVLEKREFVARGEVSNWLTSDAFDLATARSLPAERAIGRARTLLAGLGPRRSDTTAARYSLTEQQRSEATSIDAELRTVGLSEIDPFWVRWGRFMEDVTSP